MHVHILRMRMTTTMTDAYNDDMMITVMTMMTMRLAMVTMIMTTMVMMMIILLKTKGYI